MKLSQLLLLDDNRWPWLILVPRIVDAVEIHELSQDIQMQLLDETSAVAGILAQVTGCEKINTGALGNIVRQLHVHVIGRSEGDTNWPGPVWGFGERESYGPKLRNELIGNIRDGLEHNERIL